MGKNPTCVCILVSSCYKLTRYNVSDLMWPWSSILASLPLCRVSLPVPVSIEWTKPSNRESSFRTTLTCFPICSMWRFYGYTCTCRDAQTTDTRAKNTTGCEASKVNQYVPQNYPEYWNDNALLYCDWHTVLAESHEMLIWHNGL